MRKVAAINDSLKTDPMMMLAHVLAYAIFLLGLFLAVLGNNINDNFLNAAYYSTGMQLFSSISFTISQGFFIYIFN
jgi:lipopolysaccharide export LptBFGC system permease protein LptF